MVLSKATGIVLFAAVLALGSAKWVGPEDIHSFSNFEEVQVTLYDLHLEANFHLQIFTGSCDYHLSWAKDADVVTLDIRDLKIIGASESGSPLEFSISDREGSFGRGLTIKRAGKAGETGVINVQFETTDKGSALQWLTPAQTAGKKHPYMFSQCESIHCRSWFPNQDTPAIKAPYKADVTAQTPLTVLMSALSTGNTLNADGSTTYRFKQDNPIPSYLVAVAIGNLATRKIGPRSAVWSEPEVVDAAAYEFADTEKFIAAGESFLVPYVWGKYDLLLLPPSFPFGGMENPTLTFATPTLLAGDRSLGNVVAHEIAHSWTGNLVTNRGWNHFWCNEGFTVFMERKIVAAVQGEKMFGIEGIIGWQELQRTINVMGATNPLTKLYTDLRGVDPDDAFSVVPYEKGFNLHVHLQGLVGGHDVYMKFFHDWIAEHQFGTVTTEMFVAFFKQHFPSVSVDWDTWLYTPGMPPVKTQFDTTLADAAWAVADKWISGSTDVHPDDIKGFIALQMMVMLDKMVQHGALPIDRLKLMDSMYHLTVSHNSEIRFRWQELNLKSKNADIFPEVEKFVLEQGRMKFIVDLYRLLQEAGGPAKKIFCDNIEIYHPIAVTAVKAALHIDQC